MRFIAAQIGARRGYSVPALLESAGLLERFYTDATGNVGYGKWLVKVGPLCGFRNLAHRLAERRIPDSIKSKTVSVGLPPLRFARTRPLSASDSSAKFRAQLRWNARFGREIVKHGFGPATHLYSMLGECGPALAAAKRAGLGSITEVYILLSSEKIVAHEQRAFPQWEPPPPDLDAVRREFPAEDNLLDYTDYTICPSEAVQGDLEQNFGWAEGRSAVVPYGIDPKWLLAQTRPVPGRVLFVGTAGLRKGIQYLASAAELLCEKGRRYEFRVAGDVTSSIQSQQACCRLKFLGRIPRARIHEEYERADLFVLPSLAEGSAEAAYEALAAGLPVITTAAAGSVVRDGLEGFIVPERDPSALAAAIERIIENQSMRAELSHRAQARARQYTFAQYGKRLLAVLRTFHR